MLKLKKVGEKMRISTAGRYAVRIVVDIARSDNFVSLKEVATKENISIKYAEQIASKLLKAQILTSQRGQDGGYKLFSTPPKTSVGAILMATGDLTEEICDTSCPRKNECAGGDVWAELNSLINNHLFGISVAKLLKKEIN